MEKSIDYQEQKKARYYEAFPKELRALALVISIIFHPLLMQIYAYLLLIWSNPFLFGKVSTAKVFEDKVYTLQLIWLLIFSCLVPLLTVFMMKALGLIKDIALSDKMDRIGPYIIVGLLYIVIFMNFVSNTSLPSQLSIFALGSTIGLFTAFIINLFSKISMHTVGMGGFLAMVIIIMANSHAGNEYVLVLAILAAGLSGTSRMLLAAHEPADLYGGYLIGFLAQFVALSYLQG